MWYLIKSSTTDKYSIRYYPSINEGHSILCVSSATIWVSDINKLQGIAGYSPHCTGPSLKDFYNRTGYLIKPLPEIPMNLSCIGIIKSFYPELFL